MYNKNQCLARLDEMVAYAVTKGFDQTKLNTMVATLKQSIVNFFAEDLSGYVESCITAMIHASVREGIVFENYEIQDSGSTPTGYDDVRTLFYFTKTFAETTDETFVLYISESFDALGGEQIYTSSWVDQWESTWISKKTIVPSNLSLIADFANQAFLGNTLQILIEAPKIQSVPKLKNIAQHIYSDNGYRETIEKLNLDVYEYN